MAYTDQLMKSSLGSLSSTGQTLAPMGIGDVGRASDYFRTLLGGDRQSIMAQAMPEMNLALDQSAGQRRSAAARGSNRTGAGAASEAQSADDIRKNFDMLIGGQRAQAAQNLANISNEELGVMSNILGNVASVSQADVASRRAASAQMWSALIGGATGIAGAFIGKPKIPGVPPPGGGGPSPATTATIASSNAPAPFQAPAMGPLPGTGVFNPGNLAPPPPSVPQYWLQENPYRYPTAGFP